MQNPDIAWYIRKRYFVVFFIICGHIMGSIMRSNLSIAILDMTTSRIIINENSTQIQEKAEFDWNSMEIGFVLSSYAWGGLFGFIGGLLVNEVGGVMVYGAGTATVAFFTILSPIMVRFNFLAFLIFRILEGAAEFCATVSVIDIFVYWTPPNERSRMISSSYIGLFVSPAIAYPLCGYIVNNYGWEAVFFISGGISLLWYLLWLVFVSRTPEKDRLISTKEKYYLMEAIQISTNTKVQPPWKKIFQSKAVWAFWNQRFVECWSLSFFNISFPMFIQDIQNGSIDEVGYISGIPHIAVPFAMILASFLADYVRKRQILSITNTHKLFIGGGMLVCVLTQIFLIWRMDLTTAIICMTGFRFASGFIITSCGVLPIDIAQRHSSCINGISQSLNIAYIINPIIIGWMVPNHTAEEWKIYIIFLIGIFVYGILIFLLFGSGKLEPWAAPKEDNESTKKTNGVVKAN